MSAEAILLMALTIIVVWGGLVASIVALTRIPVPDGEEDPETPPSPSTRIDPDAVPDNI